TGRARRGEGVRRPGRALRRRGRGRALRVGELLFQPVVLCLQARDESLERVVVSLEVEDILLKIMRRRLGPDAEPRRGPVPRGHPRSLAATSRAASSTSSSGQSAVTTTFTCRSPRGTSERNSAYFSRGRS